MKISIFDSAGMERLRSQCAVQPHGMKLFYNAVFKKFLDVEDALAILPEAVRSSFSNKLSLSALTLVERRDSGLDGATKLAFETKDGYWVESVILRHTSGRTSLCISSQVGCACGCCFCATGEMGFFRNLSTDEILDQVLQAVRLVRSENRVIRNVVFMGMGEPFHNQEHLYRAIGFLTDPKMFDFPRSKLTVSTVGIPAAMLAFAGKYPRVNLALSLHSARQDVREKLMPLAKKHDLDVLREAMISISSSNQKVMVEYLMLEGVNDAAEDLGALIDYLSGLAVHINLIPFNAYSGSLYKGTKRKYREFFSSQLKAAGFAVTLRCSLGQDISAACGQLVKE